MTVPTFDGGAEARLRRAAPRPSSRRRRAVLAGIVAALASLSAAAAPIETEVAVWVASQDRRGRPHTAELAAADLEARVGDLPAVVMAVGEPALGRLGEPPAQVAVYFDRQWSDAGTVRRAAGALGEAARRLADLGEVSVVDVDESAFELLRSRDPFVLGEHLSRTALTGRGDHQVRRLRESALRAVATLPANDSARIAARVAAAVAEEAAMLRARADLLLSWAAGQPAAPARVLLLVAEGWDLDPLAFWSAHLSEETLRAVVALLVERGGSELSFEPLATETARALSALGWIVVPLAPEAPDAGRFRGAETVTRDPTGRVVDRSGGLTTTPGRIFGDREGDGAGENEQAVLLVEPRRSLELLAAASGGTVATAGGLAETIAGLAGRREVRLRATLPADGEVAPLTLVARDPAVAVDAPRWVAAAPPPAVAAARLRRLLAAAGDVGGGAAGDEGLDVTAVLVSEARGVDLLQGTLEVRVLGQSDTAGGAEGAAGEPAELLLSTAVLAPGGEPEIRHRRVAGASGERGETLWELSLTVPDEAQIAVLVSEPHGGRWGGVLAGVRHVAPASDEALPTADVVALDLPDDDVLRGRVRVAARPLDPRVARVLFLLDDRQVGEADAPPWRVRLDLGDVPRRRRLEAVALDAAGVELGRELALLNEGHGGFAVDIVRPRDPRGTGAVEVAAEVAVPEERRLDRVLFYWNNELVATLFAPPFRQRILVPAERPVGYVRVVALLDDGTLAEDAVVMNGPQAAERVDVRLVEVYTVVTDRDGRPVSDLQREDFRVRENGELQEIATFRAASELPITLGMAIDSSSSMFVKLPQVQEAVVRFLGSAFDEGDRGFVVDFDSQPRLVRGLTGDPERLRQAVWSLEPSGRTALWEAVVYSLVQLQGISGRKALVVFSDGADEDDQFPFGSALDVARRMGVPVYLIFMRHEPDPGLGNLLGRSFASRVDRLVDATGGRVFYAKEYEDLGAVYEEIERELRSQYLIAYYPPSGSATGWREIDVEVTREGLEPRTLSGYYD